MTSQKTVNLFTRFAGELRIEPIETMTTGRILINLVVEFFLVCFQGIYQRFNLQYVYIFVVGIGMNQQGCL